MKKIINVILLSLFFLFGVNIANAAEMALVSPVDVFSVGQQFQVNLVLTNEKESINALEGDMSFPAELLELQNIQDGDSIINFWIKRPKVPDPQLSSAINFSGVIVGGYKGKSGKVFSMVFKTKKTGAGAIEIKNVRAMLNDGKATPAQLDLKKFTLKVKDYVAAPVGAGFKSAAGTGALQDNTPPEPFTPLVSNDPKLFGGKLALIFATQDKGSGIDHYEVREGSGPFMTVTSPYILKNQKADASIIVRAFDKAGNMRDAFYAPPKSASSATTTESAKDNRLLFPWLGAFLILVGLYLVVRFIKWRHR